MFRRKKKDTRIPYDPAAQKPVIRTSICTGEQVGGLKDLKTGKFTDLVLIRDESDLQAFQAMVGTIKIEKEY